ncbi:MAG: hypothetical protein JXX28_18865 [Deltaproteobacteria bacterium]|nr:hypothetical protein [Deltaproteobacteria bacterium]
MSDFVSVQVPAELAEAVQAIAAVVAQVKEAARRREEDFRSSEGALGAKVSELESEARTLMLSELDETAPRIVVEGET